MKILILSDLHLEFSPFNPSSVDVDLVVLAGDIWTGNQAIPWARKMWPNKPIVYVAGNHEFYKHDYTCTQVHLRKAADEHGVNYLENDEFVIDGVRFLGCTLWTDFLLFDQQKECLVIGDNRLNDFRLISQDGKRFTARDSLDIHKQSRRWLSNKLINESFEGNTVVVTHHAPSFGSVADRYKKDLLSACFASHLDKLLGYSKLWIHGHTHDSFDYEINGTRVICNPQGYIFGRIENLNFDPGKIIEI